MANQKISALTALTGANVDTANDVLAIVDTSAAATKKILINELRIALLSNTALTNSLSGDVALNNTGTYFTGPTVAQGTSGTWFATGTICVTDGNGAANFNVKLWDGTTVIASTRHQSSTTGSSPVSISISGYIAAPAGNIRISVNDDTSTGGTMRSNSSGNSKDCTLSVFRIG